MMVIPNLMLKCYLWFSDGILEILVEYHSGY